MYLQDDYLAISIGNLKMNSFQTAKPEFVLDPDAISGWTDGVGTKRDNTPRPISWGDFPEPSYKNARLISITGTAIARNATELQLMRDDFMGTLQHGSYEEMRVETSTGRRNARYAIVGIEGTPRWVQQHDTIATWKLDLYAPDPRIYGVEQRMTLTDTTVTGGADFPITFAFDYGSAEVPEAYQIYNYGNTQAWPKFIVTGDYFLGFEVTNGNSKKIRYEGVVTRSAPVTIDMGAGTAMQSGVDNSHLLTRRDWFSIPPNSSIQPMFYPIQDAFGWCDIIFRDTWI